MRPSSEHDAWPAERELPAYFLALAVSGSLKSRTITHIAASAPIVHDDAILPGTATMQAPGAIAAALPNDSGQVLTFALGAEIFGIDILRVREIRGWQPVTVIPETPSHVLGVLNLRGTVVPVVNLRVRMGMPPIEHSGTTVIIVVATESQQGLHEMGLLVDKVCDVAKVAAANIQALPAGFESRAHYVHGIDTASDPMVMILDIDRFNEAIGTAAPPVSASA